MRTATWFTRTLRKGLWFRGRLGVGVSDMVVERQSTSAILILLSWWLAVVSSNGILPLYPRPGKIELAD